MKFQKGCTCTTAEYLKEGDADWIRVRNSCKRNGERTLANLRAYVEDEKTNSKLSVGFVLPQISFLRQDYWIIALDDKNYQWAMVSNHGGDTLWILARQKTLDQALVKNLLGQAKSMGIDLSKFVMTDQINCQ